MQFIWKETDRKRQTVFRLLPLLLLVCLLTASLPLTAAAKGTVGWTASGSTASDSPVSDTFYLETPFEGRLPAELKNGDDTVWKGTLAVTDAPASVLIPASSRVTLSDLKPGMLRGTFRWCIYDYADETKIVVAERKNGVIRLAQVCRETACRLLRCQKR